MALTACLASKRASMARRDQIWTVRTARTPSHTGDAAGGHTLRVSASDTPVAAAPAGGLESAAPPVEGARFPCLDGVRALAALTVVLTHVGFQTGAGLNGDLRTVLGRFDAGVAVFFVLSGFLLHRPQALAARSGRPLPRVRPYLWRRALRVLPAYWLAVALAYAVVPEARAGTLGGLLGQLTLTRIYVADPLLPGLTQMWSLGTEISFYLALPLLGRLVQRRGLRGQLLLCGAMYAVALLWQVAVARDVLAPHLGYWLPGHADWFALGMALAALRVWDWRPLDDVATAAGTCWLGAAALFAIVGTPLGGPLGLEQVEPTEAVVKTVLYGVIATLLVLPGVAGDQDRTAVRAVLRSRPAVFLGRVSYGLFLLHLAVLELVRDLLDVEAFTGRFWLVTSVVLPVSVLLAWASLRLVEEPALRLRDRGPASTRG